MGWTLAGAYGDLVDMASQRIPHEAISALCEKELEILRLLASGHTAKSIASRLNRSETAINERLREARRKTGIGSSRELARLLAAQKIWDKKIDLTAEVAAGDSSAMPPFVGHSLSKGHTVMLIAIPLAAIGAGLAMAGPSDQLGQSTVATEASANSVPLVGRWSLDVDRIPIDERPRSVTITFAAAQDGAWTTVVEIVAADGSASTASSTAGLDGKPVPISGNMGFIDTVALRQPKANTLVMTLGKGGVPVSTRVYTVADDGRSMIETIVWASEAIPKLETTYFTRIG